MPEIYIGSIAAAPIIVALVQLMKMAGMPTKYAIWANAALACAAYGLNLLLGARPEWQEPIYTGLNLLITFLAAAGIYDVAQNVVGAKSNKAL